MHAKVESRPSRIDRSVRRRRLHGSSRTLAAAALAAAGVFAGSPAHAVQATEPGIVVRPGEIEFTATVGDGGFDRGLMMTGYHAVVWKGGRAASFALLDSDVSDRAVLAALSAIARPGPSLPMDTWERRHDPASAAPELKASGPRVEVLLRLPGRAGLVPLADVLDDPAGRGLEFRFAGNERNISIWKSGCIVCLYSCPGGKIGNSRYTDRDYARGTTRFRTRTGAMPPAGTRVGVVLRIAPVPPRSGGS